MKKFISNLPITVSAIGLSFAGLANLYEDTPLFKWLFILLSCITVVSVIVKIILFPNIIKKQLQNVAIASTFPTFFMSLAFLSKHLLPYSAVSALFLWCIATLCHVIFIAYFSKLFAFKRELSEVIPSWFIVYVGIVASAITAPLFQIPLITMFGKILLFFGYISFLLLFPIIINRLTKINLPLPLEATLAILAAPAALNLVGYFSIINNKNQLLVYIQYLIVLFLYLFVLVWLPKLLKNKFSPAQAALTFPLVISATAFKKSALFLQPASSMLSVVSIISLAIATLIVLIVSIKFIKFSLN